MTTNNTKLEQIAKQVSLLNRLIEQLRMQELPYHPSQEDEEQKAWSDELVKVARDLVYADSICRFNVIQYTLSIIRSNLGLWNKNIDYTKSAAYLRLEAVLNHYGRSLSEI